MDFMDIRKICRAIYAERNSRSIPEFEGYSPTEMHQILHFTFEAQSPLKIQKLNAEDYEKIPLLNLVRFLLQLIEKNKEIKLTEKGFLPTKFVFEIYNQGFLKKIILKKVL